MFNLAILRSALVAAPSSAVAVRAISSSAPRYRDITAPKPESQKAPKSPKTPRAPKTTKAAKPKSASKAAVKPKSPKKQDLDLPLPPKAPASPYTLFFKQFYAENKDKYRENSEPKTFITVLAKAAGEAWSNLPASETQRLDAEAAKLQAEYKKVYLKYYESLTDEERRKVEKHTGKKLRTPGGRVNYLRSRKEAGLPTRPPSAFFMFLHSTRGDIAAESDGSLTPVEQQQRNAKVAGERWREMSEADKKKWTDLYREAREKYEKAVAEGK